MLAQSDLIKRRTLNYQLTNSTVLKLGVATLCRVAKFQNRVAKLCLAKQNIIFVRKFFLLGTFFFNKSTNRVASYRRVPL